VCVCACVCVCVRVCVCVCVCVCMLDRGVLENCRNEKCRCVSDFGELGNWVTGGVLESGEFGSRGNELYVLNIVGN